MLSDNGLIFHCVFDYRPSSSTVRLIKLFQLILSHAILNLFVANNAKQAHGSDGRVSKCVKHASLQSYNFKRFELIFVHRKTPNNFANVYMYRDKLEQFGCKYFY